MFVLEMRSTQNWDDVRYREYTSSERKAEAFKSVPSIKFTDSGHHIIPVVREHSGRRKPTNRMLREHVDEAMRGALPRVASHAERAVTKWKQAQAAFAWNGHVVYGDQDSIDAVVAALAKVGDT